MTLRQGQAAAFVCLVLGILGVWVSKRPTTDIVSGVLGGAGFLLFMAPSVLRWWGNKQSRERVARHRRAEQETPWRVYSQPSPLRRGVWEIGIHRRTADGAILDREPPDHTVPSEDALEISLAEAQALDKATRYNDAKVRM